MLGYFDQRDWVNHFCFGLGIFCFYIILSQYCQYWHSINCFNTILRQFQSQFLKHLLCHSLLNLSFPQLTYLYKNHKNTCIFNYSHPESTIFHKSNLTNCLYD